LRQIVIILNILFVVIELGCECKPGFKETANQENEFFPECEACPFAASFDKK